MLRLLTAYSTSEQPSEGSMTSFTPERPDFTTRKSALDLQELIKPLYSTYGSRAPRLHRNRRTETGAGKFVYSFMKSSHEARLNRGRLGKSQFVVPVVVQFFAPVRSLTSGRLCLPSRLT